MPPALVDPEFFHQGRTFTLSRFSRRARYFTLSSFREGPPPPAREFGAFVPERGDLGVTGTPKYVEFRPILQNSAF